MPEVAEQPIPQEMKHEAPIVGKVRRAIEKAWEGTKDVNAKYLEVKHTAEEHVVAGAHKAWEGAKAVNEKYVEMRNDAKDAVVEQAHKAVEGAKAAKNEYWEIRHAMQDRLAWHGGGVYKYYVENMDKVTNVMWGSKEPKFGNKVMEIGEKLDTRLKGALIAGSSATADIIRNVWTWPRRLILPIPKDVYKRKAILNTADYMAKRGIADVGLKAITAEPAVNRGVKAVAEAVWTAPEAGYKMAKPRVEEVVDKILHPKPPMPAKA